MTRITSISRHLGYDTYMRHGIILAPRELGQAIRQVRLRRGLQQEELAEMLGVSRMTISRMERGAPVSMETAMRALSECGYGVAVVPKFSRVEVTDG